MHQCNPLCDVESCFEVLYTAKECSVEGLMPYLAASFRGYKVINVTKLLEWDPVAAAVRMQTELGIDLTGRWVYGQFIPTAAFGIRVLRRSLPFGAGSPGGDL